MDLNTGLQKHKLCLSNLPSVADLTFAGLIATGSHGTGFNHSVFGTFVTEL